MLLKSRQKPLTTIKKDNNTKNELKQNKFHWNEGCTVETCHMSVGHDTARTKGCSLTL